MREYVASRRPKNTYLSKGINSLQTRQKSLGHYLTVLALVEQPEKMCASNPSPLVGEQ